MLTISGKNETRDAEIHVRARCSGKEVAEICIHQPESERSRFDDNVTHLKRTRETVRCWELPASLSNAQKNKGRAHLCEPCAKMA